MASGSEDSLSTSPRTGSDRPKRVPYFSRPKQPRDWHWGVALIGKALITVGVLMFLFVGYQLWGTGIHTAQAQNRLEDEFQAKLAATTTTTTTLATDTTDRTSTTVTTTIPTAPAPEPISNGDPIANLRIPRLGLDWAVVEGVTHAALKDGPGHFRETVMPGQLGNSAIAGHRTTYGHPFLEIDQLERGDLIKITTLVGTYVYEVTGSEIVAPSDYAAAIPTVDPKVATLVLVTCDPPYTARTRLIVRATLVLEESSQVYAPPTTSIPTTTVPRTVPGATTTTNDIVTNTTIAVDAQPDADITDDAFSEGWFSDSAAFPHVLGWVALLVAVCFGAYFIGRKARRLYVSFLVGFVPFIFVLYFVFENINRLLPPGL